jgi:hypothetical protein
MPSDLSDAARIARAKDHPWCDLGAEIVVLRARDGAYYRLDATGRTVWLMLEAPRTLTDLLAQLANVYEGDPAVVAAETRDFVGQCTALGLLAVEADHG